MRFHLGSPRKRRLTGKGIPPFIILFLLLKFPTFILKTPLSSVIFMLKNTDFNYVGFMNLGLVNCLDRC